jgi:hypothetical protein
MQPPKYAQDLLRSKASKQLEQRPRSWADRLPANWHSTVGGRARWAWEASTQEERDKVPEPQRSKLEAMSPASAPQSGEGEDEEAAPYEPPEFLVCNPARKQPSLIYDILDTVDFIVESRHRPRIQTYQVSRPHCHRPSGAGTCLTRHPFTDLRRPLAAALEQAEPAQQPHIRPGRKARHLGPLHPRQAQLLRQPGGRRPAPRRRRQGQGAAGDGRRPQADAGQARPGRLGGVRWGRLTRPRGTLG